MKIAVVGSREFRELNLVTKYINAIRLEDGFEYFITGGAKGVDKAVEDFCSNHNILCKVIRPINPANKLDYLFRNVEIITLADKILAFWDNHSRGTKFTIDYAKARGKDIEVVRQPQTI